VEGELAAFNAATGTTTTFKNVDPMLISSTDFWTKATSRWSQTGWLMEGQGLIVP